MEGSYATFVVITYVADKKIKIMPSISIFYCCEDVGKRQVALTTSEGPGDLILSVYLLSKSSEKISANNFHNIKMQPKKEY